MVDFFGLSLRHQILLGFATLMNYREPEEIKNWIDRTVDYYGKNETPEFRKANKRAVGTIANTMSAMSKFKSSDKQPGFLLEAGRTGKRNTKLVYRSGEYVADTRLSALILDLLWKVYNANNKVLTKEQAEEIAGNNEELILHLASGKPAIENDIKWLRREISKEEHMDPAISDNEQRAAIFGFDKFKYIVSADYFCEKKGGLVEPTNRLRVVERDYVRALIDFLPELQAQEKN